MQIWSESEGERVADRVGSFEQQPEHAAGSRRSIAVGFLLVVLLLSVAHFWHTRSVYDGLIPPAPGAEMSDMGAFVSAMPRPSAAFSLQINGKLYIELVGPTPSALVLPSGPPAYVFDDGQLVEWTSDLGDDPDFASRWHAGERIELTGAELIELLGAP